MYVDISKEVYIIVWISKWKHFIIVNDKLSNILADFNKKLAVFNSLRVGHNNFPYNIMVASTHVTQDNRYFEGNTQ